MLPRPPSSSIPIPAEPIPSQPSFAEPLQTVPEPSSQATKSAFDLTDSEKYELRQRKRRKFSSPEPISVTPLASITPPPLSPPRSPSPLLSTHDITPEHLHPPSRSPTPIPIPSDPPTTAPQPTSPSSTADPGPSTSTNPPPFIPPSDFPHFSFFPTDTNPSIPSTLFQLFNLPSDNSHFSPFDLDSLLSITAQHFGQTLGGFSRLLTLQGHYKDQSSTITQLQSELHLLHQAHNQLQDDHQSLHTQLDANATINSTLETYLLEQTTTNERLRTQLTTLTTEHTTLQQQSNDQITNLKQTVDGLQKTVSDLREENKEKDEALHLTAVIHHQLEEENTLLKTQHQTLKEDNRSAIIEEYKRSDELINVVLDQYGKGYSFAKGRVKNSGVNPKDLGFSSDEDGDAP